MLPGALSLGLFPTRTNCPLWSVDLLLPTSSNVSIAMAVAFPSYPSHSHVFPLLFSALSRCMILPYSPHTANPRSVCVCVSGLCQSLPPVNGYHLHTAAWVCLPPFSLLPLHLPRAKATFNLGLACSQVCAPLSPTFLQQPGNPGNTPIAGMVCVWFVHPWRLPG